MTGQASVDHASSPPRIDIPRAYNAARRPDRAQPRRRPRRQGRVHRRPRPLHLCELAERVGRAAATRSTALGVGMEQRVLLCLLDTVDFPAVFLGAIKARRRAGRRSIRCSPPTTTRTCCATAARASLVVSAALLPKFKPAARPTSPSSRHVIVSGGERRGPSAASTRWRARRRRELRPAPTTCDDVAFWLYSSGSTGAPKGTVHVQSSLVQTAELYAKPVLGIRTDDVVFSAAKLFFAYGLGNALTFPFRVGATAVLMAERPTPAVGRARPDAAPADHLLRRADALRRPARRIGPAEAKRRSTLRRCVSAGEALPEDLGDRWTSATGVDILDGIGSTEMLHIFLSNRPGEVRYGTTGKPVPGYEVRLVDDKGADVKPGEIGELLVRGPTCAAALLEQPREARAARSWAAGRAPATNTPRTRTAITSMAGAPTTCSRSAASTSRRSRSRRR